MREFYLCELYKVVSHCINFYGTILTRIKEFYITPTSRIFFTRGVPLSSDFTLRYGDINGWLFFDIFSLLNQQPERQTSMRL